MGGVVIKRFCLLLICLLVMTGCQHGNSFPKDVARVAVAVNEKSSTGTWVPDQFQSSDLEVIDVFREAFKNSVKINLVPEIGNHDYIFAFLSSDSSSDKHILGQYYLWVNNLNNKGRFMDFKGGDAYEIPADITLRLLDAIESNMMKISFQVFTSIQGRQQSSLSVLASIIYECSKKPPAHLQVASYLPA